ncbi:MAG: hypothetical protein ABSG25_12480 [Bryobacteraceae bacterium]
MKLQGEVQCDLCGRWFFDTGEFRRDPVGKAVCRSRLRCLHGHAGPERAPVRKPVWVGRAATGILPWLEELPDIYLDRRGIEEIFRVSRSEANRLIRRAGAIAIAGRLVIPRPALLAWLRKVLASETAQVEENRVTKLSEILAAVPVEKRRRARPPIARSSQAEELQATRFSKLPPGVALTTRELKIEFFGTEDFLQKFGAVIYALQNDYEQISAFIEAEASRPADQAASGGSS